MHFFCLGFLFTCMHVKGLMRSCENPGILLWMILWSCLTGENGVMSCRVYDVQMAVQKEARLLLFQDTEGFDNLSCLERVTSAQISSKIHSLIRIWIGFNGELCVLHFYSESVNFEPQFHITDKSRLLTWCVHDAQSRGISRYIAVFGISWLSYICPSTV